MQSSQGQEQIDQDVFFHGPHLPLWRGAKNPGMHGLEKKPAALKGLPVFWVEGLDV